MVEQQSIDSKNELRPASAPKEVENDQQQPSNQGQSSSTAQVQLKEANAESIDSKNTAERDSTSSNSGENISRRGRFCTDHVPNGAASRNVRPCEIEECDTPVARRSKFSGQHRVVGRAPLKSNVGSQENKSTSPISSRLHLTSELEKRQLSSPGLVDSTNVSHSKPIAKHRVVSNRTSEAPWGICGRDGCEKASQQSGFCRLHGGLPLCSVEGCSTKAVARGVCTKHGARSKCRYDGCSNRRIQGNAHGLCLIHATPGEVCFYEGCKNISVKGGLCQMHGGLVNSSRKDQIPSSNPFDDFYDKEISSFSSDSFGKIDIFAINNKPSGFQGATHGNSSTDIDDAYYLSQLDGMQHGIGSSQPLGNNFHAGNNSYNSREGYHPTQVSAFKNNDVVGAIAKVNNSTGYGIRDIYFDGNTKQSTYLPFSHHQEQEVLHENTICDSRIGISSQKGYLTSPYQVNDAVSNQMNIPQGYSQSIYGDTCSQTEPQDNYCGTQKVEGTICLYDLCLQRADPGAGYCWDHLYGRNNTSSIPLEDSPHIGNSLCAMEGCINVPVKFKRFCYVHTCQKPKCVNVVDSSGQFCSFHSRIVKCSVLHCWKGIQNDRGYCEDHTCCSNGCTNVSVSSEDRLCKVHSLSLDISPVKQESDKNLIKTTMAYDIVLEL